MIIFQNTQYLSKAIHFDHTKDLFRRIKEINYETNFVSITDKIISGRPPECHTYAERKIAISARRIFVDEISRFSFPKGAQFVLSKKSIRFHTKLAYQKIMDLMLLKISPNDTCLDKSHGRSCPKDCEYRHPFSAWVMERLWTNLFDSHHKTIYD